ncbi:hypothetical protein JOL62DRAFT_186515 [Phyllosticta paracitricarpa]|uniref:Uncharacterized protein n=1 Tax=Phyllosticta paracitricarpa TaxID=2016321 RepID=A0ABR1N1N5_9PEZI
MPHNLSQPVALHEESHGSATPAALADARDDNQVWPACSRERKRASSLQQRPPSYRLLRSTNRSPAAASCTLQELPRTPTPHNPKPHIPRRRPAVPSTSFSQLPPARTPRIRYCCCSVETSAAIGAPASWERDDQATTGGQEQSKVERHLLTRIRSTSCCPKTAKGNTLPVSVSAHNTCSSFPLPSQSLRTVRSITLRPYHVQFLRPASGRPCSRAMLMRRRTVRVRG